MAALSETGAPTLLDLRHVRAPDLETLLTEEVAEWKESLDWDIQASTSLVRRFVSMRALNGQALVLGRELIGYSYFVVEESKGLVGDLYVRRDYRCAEYEDRLLDGVIGTMANLPNLGRIEAQLMLLDASLDRHVPRPESLRRYERNFMVIDRDQAMRLAPSGLDDEIQIEPWSHRAQEQAASLIAAAYRGHVDSEINDQYRSVAGARRFLLNIVQYPGCGSFFQPGSFLARRSGTGELVGLALASLVAPLVGHITQVCVSPEAREGGIGRELVQHCLQGLMALGCGAASLTVTAENSRAVNLYRHLGFVKERSFAAYVWENLR